MYLGVHTPLDVGVSLLAAGVLVLALYRPMMKVRSLTKLWLFALIPTALYLFYADAVYRASIPLPELADAVKNGWCMFGAISGCAAISFIDEHFVGFETKAVWWAQVLKVVLGLALVVAVKSLLKAPLYALLGQGSGIADAIRYCVMVLAAGALWPMSFACFARLGKK